jgi:hypothetical protein
MTIPKTNDSQADVIKVAAVLTAAPRWAGALMAADGVPVPVEWQAMWRIGAFILSLAMAAVEGFAISYVFNAWRNQQDKRSRLLLYLAILMLVDFGMILAPYVVANVSQQELATVLGPSWLLWLWSAAVAASTGLVVGSVGYSQKEKPATTSSKSKDSQKDSEQVAAVTGYACDICGATSNKDGKPFGSWQAVAGHKRWTHSSANGKEPERKQEEQEA